MVRVYCQHQQHGKAEGCCGGRDQQVEGPLLGSGGEAALVSSVMIHANPQTFTAISREWKGKCETLKLSGFTHEMIEESLI